MNISLSPETQKLLTKQMANGRFSSPDEAVHSALRTLEELRGEAIEDLDEGTQAALDRAFDESGRGEGRPWTEVRAELQTKLHKK
jgi:putative addiction module CopG family antidote